MIGGGPAVPNELADALKERRAILFAGAGLSRAAGGLSWQDLLVDLVRLAEREQIDLGDSYERAIELAKGPVDYKYALATRLREKLVGGLLESRLRELLEPLQVTDLHRRLVSLSWSGYITTNYDTLLEDAHQEVHGERPRTLTWDDPDELARLDEFDLWVLKLHGCITRAGTVVLDQKALDEVLSAGAPTRRLGSQFDRLHTVFIGYGLGDPDVMQELRGLTQDFLKSSKRHFALVASDSITTIWRDHLIERYMVHPLPYEVVNHDHASGLSSWAEALAEAAQVAGPASRRKLLFCVKAVVGPPLGIGVPDHKLLVTDRVRGWGVEQKAPPYADRLDKAFLLPPIDDVGQDSAAIVAAFSELSGLERDCIAVDDGHSFSSTKPNPALDGRSTDYTFRFIPVRVAGHDEWFRRDEVVLGERSCEWRSLDDLRNHDATMELNADVLAELAGAYGHELADLPFAMSGRVLAGREPYAQRAKHYRRLPWVREDYVLREVLERASVGSSEGVVDLGCGPAMAAALCCGELGVDYVGVDRSLAMAAEAKSMLEDVGGGKLVVADFRVPPDGTYDGWTALLKNVLHLIPDLISFLGAQLPAWGRFHRIAIVETVSPDLPAKFWVEELFKKLGVGHKEHFFGLDDVPALLEGAGLGAVETWCVEQAIEIEPWLDSFDLPGDARTAVNTHIAEAPESIVDSMKIRQEDGVNKMLRLQQLSLVSN